MTSPPPPAPPPADPPSPPPPAPPSPAPAPSSGPDGPPSGDPAELRTALADERRQRRDLETRLAQLQQASMSEHEKAVATARAEGKAEAEHAAALSLAAAEFRHAATGRIADPAAALDLLDLTKLLSRDGDPDPALITAAVDRLAGPAPDPEGTWPTPAPGRVPAGPRQPHPADNGDFFGGLLRGRR